MWLETVRPDKLASIKPQQLHYFAVVCAASLGDWVRYVDFTRDRGVGESLLHKRWVFRELRLGATDSKSVDKSAYCALV